MLNPIPCPDLSLLQQFFDTGEVPASAFPWTRDSLEQHLSECGKCQQALEGLVAGQESWEGAAKLLAGFGSDHDRPANETRALRDLIDHQKGQFPEGLCDGNVSGVGSNLESISLDFLQPSDQPDSKGRLGNYEVLDVVGRGGMGIVLKAYDPSLRRIVAIKVMAGHLASSPLARKRFVREARAAAAVSHDHVVAIYAVEETQEPPFLVMQFVSGKTLQERLTAEGCLSVSEVLRIGMQTASGLAAAHAQGLVHRDIKPANILLENGVERVKITDFGLARAVDDVDMTQSGIVAGTPQFMAPEQVNGEAIDLRSDLFSLGSVLYMLCTGRPPFRATTMMGLLKRVCEESPRPIQELNPDVPEWLADIISKLLAKRPEDRFQSAKEVADVLGQWLAYVQNPLSIPQPALLSKPCPVHEPVAQSVSRSDALDVAKPTAGNVSKWRALWGDYVRTASISGRSERAIEMADVMLTLAGFRLTKKSDSELKFIGPGLNRLWQNLLASAGEIRLKHGNGSLDLYADFNALRIRLRFAIIFLVPLIWYSVARATGIFGDSNAAVGNLWPLTLCFAVLVAVLAAVFLIRLRIRKAFDTFFDTIIESANLPLASVRVVPDPPLSRIAQFEKNLRETYPTRVFWISAAIWTVAWTLTFMDTGTVVFAVIHWLALGGISLGFGWTLGVIACATLQKRRTGSWESTMLRGRPSRLLVLPTFLLFLVSVCFWGWTQATTGSISFDIDDRDFTVSMKGPSLDWNQNFSGNFHRMRVRAGRYQWSVAHGSDGIAFGELEVLPFGNAVIRARSPYPIGEADVACMTGRWEFKWGYSGGSRGQPTVVKAAEAAIEYVDISNGEFRVHSAALTDCFRGLTGIPASAKNDSDPPRNSDYAFQVVGPPDGERGPKWIDLLHYDGQKKMQAVVAQGIFMADQKRLMICLAPQGSPRPTWSPEANARSLQFERASDRILLQGEWALVESEKVMPPDNSPKTPTGSVIAPKRQSPARMVFIGDHFEDRAPDGIPGMIVDAGVYKVDPSQNPKRITLQRKPKDGLIQVTEGIYRVDGDQLTLCLNNLEEVPRDFEPKPSLKPGLLKFKRVKE